MPRLTKQTQTCERDGCSRTFDAYWYDRKHFCSRSCSSIVKQAAESVRKAELGMKPGRPPGRTYPSVMLSQERADEWARDMRRAVELLEPMYPGHFYGGGR